jgi:hypothetical protein
VRGVSQKFKRIGNRYNIRTIFRTKHTLKSTFTRSRLERDPLQTAQRIYSIPCECGRSYIGETGRRLAVRLHAQRHNVQQSLLEKSELAQHVYKERHRAGWDEARIWKLKVTAGIENTRSRAIWHAQPIQSANPVWTFLLSGSPLLAMRLPVHREDLYDVTDSSCVSIRFQSRVFTFYSTDGTTGRYYMSSQNVSISLHWCSCTWFCGLCS